jgi:hypothetical protein
MIRWQDQPALPKGVAAILSGLKPSSNADWKDALDYADRFQLTLALDLQTARVEEARVRNIERNARILKLCCEILNALSGRYEIVVLKGIAHASLFQIKPEARIQYDVDLFSPEHSAEIEAILKPFSHQSKNYQWNGDFYDPGIPIQIDLHKKLWDERMEGFPAPGVDDFWARRTWIETGGLRFQTLAPTDALGFAALHMLKHILHGDARPMHALEIASFLRLHREPDQFWEQWRKLHSPELRRLESIAFRFAAEWFGCPLPGEALDLPLPVEEWFLRFAASPITSYFQPNKDELALNLLLINGNVAKARVAARRLFPLQWPRPFPYAVARAVFHARALLPAVLTMFRMRR